MRRGILQKLSVGDHVRVLIRYPGPGRMVEATRAVGRVSGFIRRDGVVTGHPSRSATCGIIERTDAPPIVFVPGRDVVEGVGDHQEGAE